MLFGRIHLALIGQAMILCHLIQQAHRSVAAQAAIDFLPHTLPGKSVGQIQSPKAPTVGQSAVDKIHAPTLPWSAGRQRRTAFLALEALLALLSQGQLFLPIQADTSDAPSCAFL